MVGDPPDPARDAGSDLGPLLARRAAEYLDLWEGAVAKLTASSYRSEDLLDDWFRLCGMSVRDMTACAALMWRAAGSAPRRDGTAP